MQQIGAARSAERAAKAGCRSRRPRSGLQEPPAEGGAAGAAGARRRAGAARRSVPEPPSRRRRAGAGAAGAAAAGRAAQPRTTRQRQAAPTWLLDRLRGVRRAASRCSTLFLSFARLEIFKMLLASFFPLLILILAVLGSIVFGLATPTEAAAVGALGGFLLAAAYRQLTLERAEGIGVPHRQDLGHGVLAVRRLGHLLGRLRAARRAGAGRALGARHEPQQDPVPGAEPGHHLRAGLAAGVDRDHRDLHADLHPAARQLRRRSAVLRPAGGAEPADRLPVARRWRWRPST